MEIDFHVEIGKNEKMKFDSIHIDMNRIELRHKFVSTVKGKSEAPSNILSIFVP